LYYISDGLTIAHLSRLSAAKDAWKSALALNKTNSDFYGNEYSEVIWPTNIGIDYSNAVTRLPMVAQQIPAINALGKFASSQDDTLQGPYADLKKVLRDRLNETLALYDKIALWSNKPRISFIFRLPKLPPQLPVISLD